MKLIEPDVELWNPLEPWQEKVARAARLCYGNDKGSKTADEMCTMLKRRGHLSMFRHGTLYFVIKGHPITKNKFLRLSFSPYMGVRNAIDWKDGSRVYFVSMNLQYALEHIQILKALKDYNVSLAEFIIQAKRLGIFSALSLIRYTLCLTTQISTSRELNRTSPNNIAEQSTRYVNFGKRGGITICKPHWYDGAGRWQCFAAKILWEIADVTYRWLQKLGMKPEDARGILPLDTATRVVYTYSVPEWKAILALRLKGTTGKPHPNARLIAEKICNELLETIWITTGRKINLV